MSFNHTQDPVMTVGSERLTFFTVINCAGASPTIQDSNIPGLVTAAHPATGTYRITFPTGTIPAQAAKACIRVSIGNASSVNSICLYSKANLASAGQLDIFVLTAGSAADLASGELSVEMTFENTSTTY